MNSSNHTDSTAPAIPAINPPRRVRTIKPDNALAVQPIRAKAQPTPAKEQPQPQAVNPRSRAVRVKPPRGKRAKRQPTGNYPVGFAKAPEHSRFQPNNPGGPGRPKGSRSQNSILRKELEAKRVVRIDGRGVKLSNRELATKMFLTKAFEKSDPKQLMQVIQFSQHLFPETTEGGTAITDPAATAILDQQILSDFWAGREMGEPCGAGAGVLPALGIGIAAPGPGIDDGDWASANDDSGADDLARDEEFGDED